MNEVKDEPMKDEPMKDEPMKDEPMKDEPMKDAVNKLIDQTYSYYVESDGDLKECYYDDYRSFIVIRNLLELGKYDVAERYIDFMDTAPREQIMEALSNA